MLPLSYLRFKSRPADPLRPPPRGNIDVFYSSEEGKFIARDWQGSRVTFDATGGVGSSEWGEITGTLSSQTDLQAALDAKQASAATLTSWAAVSRAAGFDGFAAVPNSANLRALLTDETGTSVLYFTGGALGTPSSATLTNATGLPLGGLTGLGTGVANALAEDTGTDSSLVVFNGAGGTPSSINLTNGTSLPVAALVPTTTNDNATAGDLGEYISAVREVASAVSFSALTPVNITSIALTPGDWDVEGQVTFYGASASITECHAEIGLTSATRAGDAYASSTSPLSTTAFSLDTATLCRRRISVAGNTTVYLIAETNFSAGSVTGYGFLNARRVR